MSRSLPSITLKKDFNRIYSSNKIVTASAVFFYENNEEAPLSAFVASKKIGGSVLRNRAKRLMRAALRETINAKKLKVSIILLARHGIQNKPFTKIKEDIAYCLRKSNGLHRPVTD